MAGEIEARLAELGITLPPALAPQANYVPYVITGNLAFIAGQVAVAPDGAVVGPGDLRAQAEQVLRNIGVILAANGADFDDVVKVLVYVTDIRAFDEITDIRLRYFPQDGPASAIIEVAALAHPDFMIEIEAVAVVG